VVDQGESCSSEGLSKESRTSIAVIYTRSTSGLSRARNVGLRCITGDVVGFPDDDCWYPGGLMSKVARFFAAHPGWDGLTGRTIDEYGRPSVGRWSRTSGPVTRLNVWWRVNSATIFLRRRVIESVGTFDESLGVGAGTPWESAEELDYVLRALAAGFRICYDPGLVIYHPQAITTYDAKARARAYGYGAGIGRVIRKHCFPRWFVAYQLGRPLVGASLCLTTGRPALARYYWAGFRGRVYGWLSGCDG
jgi:glycosyltransferase involved in cell wall biosynthesis